MQHLQSEKASLHAANIVLHKTPLRACGLYIVFIMYNIQGVKQENMKHCIGSIVVSFTMRMVIG